MNTHGLPFDLEYPQESPAVWEHFRDNLDALQHAFIHSGDVHHRKLRITKCIAPAPVVPDVHKGHYAGFPVEKGDEFSVRLNTGQTITATR